MCHIQSDHTKRKQNYPVCLSVCRDYMYQPAYMQPLSTTIYLWLISLTASKELSILLLKLYNDGAIGMSSSFLGLRVRIID